MALGKLASVEVRRNSFQITLFSFLLLFFVDFAEATKEGRSIYIEHKIKVFSSASIITIGGISVDSRVSLKSLGGDQTERAVFVSRGQNAVFYFPPNHKFSKVVVQVERLHETGLPRSEFAHLNKSDEGGWEPKDGDYYAKAIGEWSNGGDQEKSNSLQKFRYLLEKDLSSQLLEDLVLKSYLCALIRQEAYSKVVEYARTISPTLQPEELVGPEENLLVLEYLAKALFHQQNYEKATPQYNYLLEISGRQSKRSTWDEIRSNEIRAEFGTLKVLYGMRLSDGRMVEQGKGLLEGAFEEASRVGDTRLVAQIQNSLAPYYFFKENFEEAERVLLRAMELAEEIGFIEGVADAANNLSVLYRRTGRPHDALAVLQKALSLESKNDYSASKAAITLNLASIYSEVGKDKLATISAGRAREEFLLVGNKDLAAQACLVLAKSHWSAGDFQSAQLLSQTCLSELLELSRLKSVVGQETYFDLSKAYLLLANGALLSGDIDVAADHAFESVKFRYGNMNLADGNQLPSNAFELDIFLLMTRLSLKHKRYDDVLNYFEILEHFFTQANNSEKFLIQKLELNRIAIDYFDELGDVLSMQEIAASMFVTGGRVSSRFDTHYLGPAWSAELANSFDKFISLLSDRAEREQNDKLFEYVFYVLERLSGSNIFSNRRGVDWVGKREDYSKTEIEATEVEEWLAATSDIDEQRTESLIRGIEKRAAVFTNKAIEEERELEEREIISVSDVQDRLETGTVAIKLYAKGNEVLIYIISTNEWIAKKIIRDSSLQLKSKKILAGIANRSIHLGSDELNIRNVFGQQSTMLQRAKKVVFSANSMLSTFPIGVLNIASDKGRYIPLDSKIEVVNTHSLSDYLNKNPKKVEGLNTDIAVFADPNFNLHTSGVNVSDDGLRAWSKSLRRLPWTAKEAHHINESFGSETTKIYVGDKATKERLMSEELRTSKVLHIATHGYFSEKTPDVVGVATAATKNEVPGFVTLTRLFSKEFNSNLIVVSGCETSLGDDLGTEGVNSLSRAFLVRGAGSVIGTLWKIPDRPTAKFINHFYSELKENNGNASEALVTAKRKMMSAGPFKHPYFWSGFILTSANRAFETDVFR